MRITAPWDERADALLLMLANTKPEARHETVAALLRAEYGRGYDDGYRGSQDVNRMDGESGVAP